MFILNKIIWIFLLHLIDLSFTTSIQPPVQQEENEPFDNYDEEVEELNDESYEEDPASGNKGAKCASFESQYVGTNLLDARALHRKCFSPEDECRLAARVDFESLLPEVNSTIVLENDRSVDAMLQYFYGIHAIIDKFKGADAKMLTQQALSDLIGGYLNYYYVPLVKLSFYAGTLQYSNAIEVMNLLTKCKRLLNTNGNGWRAPRIEWFKPTRFRVAPLNLSNSDIFDTDHPPCLNLILSEDEADMDSNTPMLVSLPKLDRTDFPNHLGSIWLPFKRKHNFNLAAKGSAFILLRYFVAVQKCYAFKTLSPKKFHRRMADWLSDRILPYVDDAVFYPGLGAVLRIVDTIQTQQGKRMVAPSAPDRFKYESLNEQPKSKEFVQIEKQVNTIMAERQKPGFFGKRTYAMSGKEPKDKQNLYIITTGVSLICVFIMITSCCWIRKRANRGAPKCQPANCQRQSPRTSWTATIFCPCRKRPPLKDDEAPIECEPNSPSVMSRVKEEKLLLKTSSEYRVAASRPSRASVKSNDHDTNRQSCRNQHTKKVNPKSCCYKPCQTRQVNSSSSSSLQYRPIGTEQQDTAPSDTPTAAHHEICVCEQALSENEETDDNITMILADDTNEACNCQTPTPKSTRIPVLQRKSKQRKEATSKVTYDLDEPALTKKTKITHLPQQPGQRPRFERTPYRPITICTKQSSNPSQSSWETIPSGHR